MRFTVGAFTTRPNHAAVRCNTEFIALLNPDAIPQPDWLEKLVAAATRHPQATSFGSLQMRDVAGGIVDGLGDVYHFSGACWRKHHGRKLRSSDLVEGEIFSPCAAAALYRRSAFLEVGGFDEDFFATWRMLILVSACAFGDMRQFLFRTPLLNTHRKTVKATFLFTMAIATSFGASSKICLSPFCFYLPFRIWARRSMLFLSMPCVVSREFS